ncbi:hypothetical protein [Novosphingobium sp. FKTRR1]|uniref:hypothetical protein n=1 Tax=unclassified Novosphingobium TaxID=2644732 RepID=UPI001CF04E5D|nr:hypothetical protein [Novosphingobium sp. FKTRR1]
MPHRKIAVIAALLIGCAPLSGLAKPAPAPNLLPHRILTCRLGHITNFDPSREQKASELKFDSTHAFALELPAIPRRTTPPPEAVDPPEKVDPRTRILSDPDHIAPQVKPVFDRVIDMWPDRVELTGMIRDPQMNVIVINPIDEAHGTANLFMLRASELTHFDEKALYQGTCAVELRGKKGK